MADDKMKRGGNEQSRVAAGQAYELAYFARKHRITMDTARVVLSQAESSRDNANALAAKQPKTQRSRPPRLKAAK